MEIVFILGSGASVDSGLPTYRGIGGLYKDNSYEHYLSYENFRKNPKDIWDFHKNLYHQISSIKQPGQTYCKIKELSDLFNKSYILTQNIDKLAHFSSEDCYDLHGVYDIAYCTNCRTQKKCSELFDNKLECSCNLGIYRPAFTMFGESLSEKVIISINGIIKKRPKIVVVTGTSLQFPYLHNIIKEFKNKNALIIYIDPDINFLNKIKNTGNMFSFFIRSDSYKGLEYLESLIKNKVSFSDLRGKTVEL